MHGSNNSLNPERLIFFLGISILLLGILYYLIFRPPPYALTWALPWLERFPERTSYINMNALQTWHNSLPSFLHVLAFSLITLSVKGCNPNNIRLVGITWLLISIIFEILQLGSTSGITVLNSPWSPISGTFDGYDLLASMMGSAVYFTTLWFLCPTKEIVQRHRYTREIPHLAKNFYLISVLLIGITSITGSYSEYPYTEIDCESSGSCTSTSINIADPVYLSYTELRSQSIYTDKDRPLTKTGKIYLYDNYIFINSPNEGIHIYDNRNPYKPLKVGFINIPGNVDIAISQGYLYVDSYIDLVTIDIRDIQAPTVVDRRIDSFPYDPYQNIPESVQLTNIDSSKGVIVGYTKL